jgi:hypothetical protein
MMGSYNLAIAWVVEGWMGKRGSKEGGPQMSEINLAHGSKFRLPWVEIQEGNTVGIDISIFGVRRRAKHMVQQVATESRLSRSLGAADQDSELPLPHRKGFHRCAPFPVKVKRAQMSFQ